MKVKEIQRLTLIDYPGRLACTLFLFGCNFRCGFCHNPELVLHDTGRDISKEEVLEFLERRRGQLDGVCITGGEPLMSLEKDFLKKIKALGYFIKIDTNGSFPEKLEEFIDEDLIDYVAMDIKSSKEKYKEVVGEVDLGKIEESIKLVSKLPEYEFRTTIVEGIHDLEDMKKLANWLNQVLERKPKRYFLQGFKNSDKFIEAGFKSKEDTSEQILTELKNELMDYFDTIEIRI